jgi:hypothetical protein
MYSITFRPALNQSREDGDKERVDGTGKSLGVYLEKEIEWLSIPRCSMHSLTLAIPWSYGFKVPRPASIRFNPTAALTSLILQLSVSLNVTMTGTQIPAPGANRTEKQITRTRQGVEFTRKLSSMTPTVLTVITSTRC